MSAALKEPLTIPAIAASHLLTDLDLTAVELRDLIALAGRVKAAPLEYAETLKHRNIARGVRESIASHASHLRAGGQTTWRGLNLPGPP